MQIRCFTLTSTEKGYAGDPKNAVLARYALSGMNRPMGISEYEVARQQSPDDLKKALPSTEEIEAGLNRR